MGIKFDKISISGSVNSLVTPISPEYWIATAGISSVASSVDSISEDLQGNFYVSGRLNNYTSAIYKFDKDGALIWARSITGNSSYTTLVAGTAVDSEDNIYQVQYERNGTFTLGIIHIVKVSSSGSLIWHRSITKSSTLLTATKFTQRQSDNALVLIGEISPGPQGSNDAFYAVVSTAGDVTEPRSIGSNASQLGHAIDLDSEGNIYVGGWTNTSAYVSKFSSSHVLAFSKTVNPSTSFDNRVYDISVGTDAFYSIGEAYISEWRSVITKYDLSGTVVQWIRGLNPAGTVRDYFYNSKIDTDGSVYVTGYSQYRTGTLVGTTIAKYLPDGTLVWQRALERAGSSNNPTGLLLKSNSMIVATSGTYGLTLAKLPKDGSLTGIYDVYDYKEIAFSTSVLIPTSSNISTSSISTTVSVSTTALPFNTVTPTPDIITI